MRRSLLVALPLLALLSAPAVGSAQSREWWKEPPESRLDQRIGDPSTVSASRVKWDDGYIEVRAAGTAERSSALNPARRRELAMGAARDDGYRRLAELVDGLAVDGATAVKSAVLQDAGVRARVQARIRSAVVVSEQTRDAADGGVAAEIVMGLRLRGAGSVAESIGAWAASRPMTPYRSDPTFRVHELYTGLLVDASDVGFVPALAPRLLEDGTGRMVFGPQMVQQAVLYQQGPLEYAAAMSDARQKGRAGANPLIVRAIAAVGAFKGDLLVSPRDAARVAAADRAGRFLDRAAVTVVYGQEQRALPAGRRHALVIGVGEEQQPVSSDGGTAQAARDARTLATLLEQSGFAAGDVVLLGSRDASRRRVLAELHRMRGKVQDEDTIVIFFSGRGSVGPAEDGRLHYFLVPHDGRLADLARTALVDDQLEEAVGNLPARRVVVLLDASFVGGDTPTIRSRSLNNPAVSAAPDSRPFIAASVGRAVISASPPDQPAFEDDQRGGLFSSFLVEALRGAADQNGDGAVTVFELFQFVSPRLGEYTRTHYHVEQRAVLEIHVRTGEIVITRRAREN
jgi:hypothetical protein